MTQWLSKQIFFEMLFFILTLSCTLTWADSETCPDEYARLSDHHSFCLDPNPTCNIKYSGVSQDEIDHILKLHNKYRSQVAMGQETRAGGLPTASDMLQMVWDNELAAVAQKWADNCVYEHDCNECRAVANFPVGQNIAYQDLICYKRQCLRTIKPSDLDPDWASVMKDFYDEVNDFDKKLVPKFQPKGGKEINHFTQSVGQPRSSETNEDRYLSFTLRVTRRLNISKILCGHSKSRLTVSRRLQYVCKTCSVVPSASTLEKDSKGNRSIH
ncbi:hypothetical protein TNCV_3974171 [Trichonephila clavipes]|nr:hypothetical protein TNCV_3974171 [Trichonephila clavipes]